MGHVAVAYILYTALARTRDEPLGTATLALGLGALFPDLVDKPLAWRFDVLPAGRTLGHSLLVLVPVSIVLYAFARRHGRGEYGIAFAAGATSHAVVDAVPTLWGSASPNSLLWPLLRVEPYPGGPPTVLGLLGNSLSDPYFLLEFVLLAVALAVWRADGFPGLAPARAVVSRDRPERP